MSGSLGAVLAVAVVWELVWKGWALWRAAQRDARGWFVALLILNTAGILPILYIFVFSRNQPPSVTGRDSGASAP